MRIFCQWWFGNGRINGVIVGGLVQSLGSGFGEQIFYWVFVIFFGYSQGQQMQFFWGSYYGVLFLVLFLCLVYSRGLGNGGGRECVDIGCGYRSFNIGWS